VIALKNPWGQQNGSDIQRADLWQLDVKSVLDYLQSLSQDTFSDSNLDQANLPTVDELTVYAADAAFPVQRIKPISVIQNSIPRNFPGYFEALDSIRVDFIHPDDEKLYTFLNMWRALARVGIVGNSGEEVSMMPSATYVPQFKFDILVRFITGSVAGVAMYGQTFTLNGCWLRGYQPAVVDRSSAGQVYKITAQLQADEIMPL
jgi:hypothetical protein